MDLQFITHIKRWSKRQATMSNERRKQTRKTKAEKKIEEIRAEVEKVLERLGQIEVEETWMKTWRTRRE